MATFFGEVVFSSSRATDDDDEDDPACEVISEEISLELSSCNTERITIDGTKYYEDVIITLGPAANVFAECFVLLQETEEIGKLNVTKRNDGRTEQTSEISVCREAATLFRLKHHPRVLICRCLDDPKSHVLFSFVQQLFSLVEAKVNVTVLLSSSGSEFKTERSEINFPILRCLKTTAFTAKPVCPYLESPNTIGGLGSAVLTHCQVHRIPAVMYVAYTETIFLDVPTINAFDPLFKTKPLESIAKKTEKSIEMLQKSVSRPSHLDSLYI